MLVYVALAGGIGCQKESTNTATPKAAAKAFLKAMATGDVAALQASSTGDDTSAQVLAAQAKQNVAVDRYIAAAAKKFGKADGALVGRRGEDHEAQRLQRIDAEPEVIDGNSATVGQGRDRIALLKVEGQWRVDRARQVPPGLGDATDTIASIDAMRRAYEQAAAEVEAGQHQTPAEARAALIIKTEAELRKLIPPAVTRPATTPVNATRPTGSGNP